MMRLHRPGPLRGAISVPGDKSISHRAALLGALAAGETVIHNYAPGLDSRSTARCAAQLGATVRADGCTVWIDGAGAQGLSEPRDVLDCGNSGTTMRLLAGVLAGQRFLSVLTGDSSLRSRPMARVVEPLQRMGAMIEGRSGGQLAPLVVNGGELRGLGEYQMPVASAQVKSCLLLAGLHANGETTVLESLPSRDHTERMLPLFGASVAVRPGAVTVSGPQSLRGAVIYVPGDISSAAYWLVLAACLPEADLILANVGFNPRRAGVLEVMRRMGADLEILPASQAVVVGEPAATIRVRSSELRATEISPAEVPSLVDELPVLAVAAAMAKGRTRVWGASELRTKECDRIAATVGNLRLMGVPAVETEDGFYVDGIGGLTGAPVGTHGDHRIALAFAVAGLLASGYTVLDDPACIDVSYPGFAATLHKIAPGAAAWETDAVDGTSAPGEAAQPSLMRDRELLAVARP